MKFSSGTRIVPHCRRHDESEGDKAMRIETTAEVLAAALRGNVAERKSTLPVLEFARVMGDRIMTTDLDSTCIADLDAKFEGEPDFLIPCRSVLSAIEGQSGLVTLEYEADRKQVNLKELSGPLVTLRHDGGTFTFPTMAAANFPILPDVPMLTTELDGAEFKKMIDRTLFSVSREESRYTLNGAMLKGDGKTMTMVATDGHRLSIVEMPADFKNEQGVLLSRPALKWMSENIVGDVSLGVGHDYHAVRTGSRTLIFRRLKGEFPNWQEVIPKEENIKVKVTFPSAKRLRSIVERVARCADERGGPTIWEFGPESRISAKSIEHGQASFPLDCAVDGELNILWRAEYILDFLGTVDDGEVKIELQSNQSGCMFCIDGARYLVMPMRI